MAALYAGYRLKLGLQLEIKLPSHNVNRLIYRYIKESMGRKAFFRADLHVKYPWGRLAVLHYKSFHTYLRSPGLSCLEVEIHRGEVTMVTDIPRKHLFFRKCPFVDSEAAEKG